MFLLFFSCSEDIQPIQNSCQLDVAITNSEMTESQSDTSDQEVVWYSEDKVQVSVQPLSSLFDTLLLLNGQPLESDETWQLYRNNCFECDNCKTNNNCLTCTDCDYCSNECSTCEEGISLELPLIQEGIYSFQVKNAFGESPLLSVYIANQAADE